MNEACPGESNPSEVLSFIIEDFGRHHPRLNPELLIERTRVALSRYHQSPAQFRIIGPSGELTASVHFGDPDPRSADTIERERCVEEGAILFGALLLAQFEMRSVIRIVPRRGRADYYLGNEQENGFWLLEASGTDRGDIHARKKKKMKQLRSTPLQKQPGFRGGYVAVTRFAAPACSLLEEWTFEAGGP
jgi:hypothetical protein